MKRTSIGGSALLEGIMMIGPYKKAVAVRKPDGNIELSVENLPKKSKIAKVPIIRGAYSLIYQMILSVKALSFAASFYEEEDEQDKDKDQNKEQNKDQDKEQGQEQGQEKKSSKDSDALSSGAIFFAILLSLAISVGLFILLPNFVVSLLKINSNVVKHLLEGLLRIVIFIAYLVLMNLMEDIKRVWQYHGAEHKTINCYEAGKELTVENVRTFTTANKRCGTSFLFLVMVISIIVFSFVGWYSPIVNALLRLLLMPLVAGIAYEVIKLAGRHDNLFSTIVSAPGMLFQKLTAKEPDDLMIECAIAAFNAVLPENEEDAKW